MLYYTILYYTIIYYTILYYTILHPSLHRGLLQPDRQCRLRLHRRLRAGEGSQAPACQVLKADDEIYCISINILYIYTHVYVCMYSTYIHTYIHTCMHACMHHMHTYVHIRTCIHMYVCDCMSIYVYIHDMTYIYVQTYTSWYPTMLKILLSWHLHDIRHGLQCPCLTQNDAWYRQQSCLSAFFKLGNLFCGSL